MNDMVTAFIGREMELDSLKQLKSRRTASLAVAKGRRRIGKSRLVQHFAQHCMKRYQFYQFSGLAPTEHITAQDQRNEFARQIAEQFKLPGISGRDWGDLFSLLSRLTESGPVIILFNEISWMGSKDKTFLSKLKIAWDTTFKNNPQLILILCGSISSWIEKNMGLTPNI